MNADQLARTPLLPCPFCAKEAEVGRSEHKGLPYFWLGCKSRLCPGNGGSFGLGLPLHEAVVFVAGWNSRPATGERSA